MVIRRYACLKNMLFFVRWGGGGGGGGGAVGGSFFVVHVLYTNSMNIIQLSTVYEKRDLAHIILKNVTKMAFRLNCYNFRTVKAINSYFRHLGVLNMLRVSIATSDTPRGSNSP